MITSFLKAKAIRISLISFSLFFLMGTMLFSQQQIKEEKADLGKISDNTQFENANQLYKIKRYDKAIELFTEYLEIYINGLHRKKAYKNIASMYFEQFQYIKSIRVYNSLYEEFSNSEEGIEAYFMTGICYQKMGFPDKAKQIFKSLIEEHPESNFALQAKIKLDLIGILENG